MNFEDIQPGRSYACKFIVREGLASNEHFGVIKTRDTNKQLAEIVDLETNAAFVVRWADCWDIDEVEWHDPN